MVLFWSAGIDIQQVECAVFASSGSCRAKAEDFIATKYFFVYFKSLFIAKAAAVILVSAHSLTAKLS